MAKRKDPVAAEDIADLVHYSRTEAAQILGVSPDYLYREIKGRRIGYTVIAGAFKITGAHIKAYSAHREVRPLAAV